ncbi:hypothetical protein ACWEQ3_50110 [Streptomyces mirabilis]
MTYGTLDGSTISPSSLSQKTDPTPWGGDTGIPTGQGTATSSGVVIPPVVPNGTGGGMGSESVYTPAMDLFAKNIYSLVKPVEDAANILRGVVVAPGAFYQADQIRTKVSGANGDAGLKDTYAKVLDDIAALFTDIGDRVTYLSKNYTSADNASKMSSADLQNAMNPAQSEFNSIMSDNGGTGSLTGSGSGSGSGN